MSIQRLDIGTDGLRELCRELAGEHMTHERLAAVACEGAWPVVDADGILTGEITDGQDGGRIVDWHNGHIDNRDGYACEAICLR